MGVMCGKSICEDIPVPFIGALTACCPKEAMDPDKCGVDITPITAFVPLPPGCMELNQEGKDDPTCPIQTVSAMGNMIDLPGCCRPNGICGNVANFGGFVAGLDFGCVDSTPLYMDGGAPPPCGGGTGGAGGAASSSSSSSSSSGAGGGMGGAGGGMGGAGGAASSSSSSSGAGGAGGN